MIAGKGNSAMKRTPNTQFRLFLAGLIILVSGLIASTIIYLSATRSTGIEENLDKANSKVYLHDLELYGGKANLLAAEFVNWFSSLWQGEALAITIACISVVISLVMFLIACTMHDQELTDKHEGNHDATD